MILLQLTKCSRNRKKCILEGVDTLFGGETENQDKTKQKKRGLATSNLPHAFTWDRTWTAGVTSECFTTVLSKPRSRLV